MTSAGLAPLSDTICCPPFDPAAWDEREVTWRDKRFVHQRLRALFHVPLGMRSHMRRQGRLIDAARAGAERPIILSDDCSPWHCDLYTEVSKDVPGMDVQTLSGTFLTKVFEGPFRSAPRWMREMEKYVASRHRRAEKVYLGYTTCPRCAAVYGKNYVVLFAKVTR